MSAPVGVVTAYNEGKRTEMLGKINVVMPDKKLADALKGNRRDEGIPGSSYEMNSMIHNYVRNNFT